MALTQDQVNWWFEQNPDATPEDVAEAVKSIGGLSANEGLAGMIANRFSIAEPDVTNYYNTYTAPKADTPVKQDTQTFTGNITSGADTTEDDFLNLVSPPADNITSNNGYTKPSTRPTSGSVSNVIEGDDIDTQIAQLPEEYASWGGSTPGYTELIRKSDGAVLDRRKLSTLSDLDLLKMGLSFVPGFGPIVAGINVADAVRKGDLTSAAIGLTGLVPGMTNVNTALKVGKAIDDKNPFGAVTALAGNTDLQKLTGFDTANLGGFTSKDLIAGASLAKAAGDNNYAGVLTNLGTLANSPDTVLAGRALTLINRFNNGDPKALFDAVNLSNSITSNKTTGATDTSLKLAGLDTGNLSDAGNGYTLTGTDGSSLTFPDLYGSGSIKLDASLFDSSVGDLDNDGFDDTTGLDTGDVIPDTGGTGGNTGGTGGDDTGDDDLGLLNVCGDGMVFNTATGQCEKVTDEGKVVVTGKRGGDSCPVGTKLNPITGDCDPYWDEGGGDVCGVGEHQDPQTGMCVPDKKELTCPPGKVPNEAGTACIDQTIITAKRDTCPVGTKLNLETGDCDPYWDEGGGEVCDPGFHQDPKTGMCVPDEEEPIKCDAGFHLGPDGKTCVPDEEDDTPCADGFHKDETGLCVPDDDEECKDGYEKVDGVCVPVCKEGYIRNLETGTCEKVETKECPPGYTRKDGKCVKDTVITPPVTCQPGYEKVNGVCVPMCQPGYQRVNGVCKKITPETVTTPINAQGERTDPIYAGAMDDFNLFATLEELLSKNSDKKDTKKDNKKSKDKTKMATGGHLDDLLAEQMTVDDLLKLLR